MSLDRITSIRSVGVPKIGDVVLGQKNQAIDVGFADPGDHEGGGAHRGLDCHRGEPDGGMGVQSFFDQHTVAEFGPGVVLDLQAFGRRLLPGTDHELALRLGAHAVDVEGRLPHEGNHPGFHADLIDDHGTGGFGLGFGHVCVSC